MKDSNTRKYNHYLYELISYLELNPNSFAEEIGLDRTDRIYNVLNNKNGVSANLASKITKRFPEISFDWLKNNEGKMLLEKVENTDMNSSSSNFKDLPIGEQLNLLHQEIADLKTELKKEKEENARNTEKIIDFVDEYFKPVFDFMTETMKTKKKDNKA
ncbi:hypothetical protein [uncultured Chryseobacterium sp.]|uniref:hypothetical protein n=1 Tax=uncultured Chryseobacterium sp. TaxID=259322 RepID=UPI002584DA70|nr:hypothetical protein [uncultured Chryseobacterium sp.]